MRAFEMKDSKKENYVIKVDNKKKNSYLILVLLL